MNHFANYHGNDLLKTINQFLTYSNFIAMPLGVVLNSLSILICIRKNRSKNTTTWFYYKIVSITNVLILVDMFTVFYYLSIGLAITSMSEFSCKFVTYSSRVLLQFSAWLNVLVTFDHVLLISQPQRYKTLTQNKKYIYLAMFGVVLVLCGVNTLNLEFGLIELVEPSYTTTAKTTTVTDTDRDFHFGDNKTTPSTIIMCTPKAAEDVLVRDIINLVMRMFLPFVLVFLGNIVLIIKFRESKRTSIANNTTPKKELDFIIVIFVLNVMFIGFTAPQAVAELMLQSYGPRGQFTASSMEMANAQLVYVIATNVAFYNHVLTFFVYLRFNALFFIEFKVLFFMRDF
jgi:hypothetical protein